MTAAAKHTPGPWRMGDSGHEIFGPPNGAVSPVARAVTHADARLIMAAPDLLEALKDLLAVADEYSDAMRAIGRGSMDLGCDAPSHSASGMARAAIAKAEGGAS